MDPQSANPSDLLGIRIGRRGLLLAGAATLLFHQESHAAVTAVDMGTASEIAIVAGAGIINTGQTAITGDVGTFSTLAITGFETVTLNGTNHGGDTISQLAKDGLGDACIDAAGRVADVFPVCELGGLALASGIYNGPSSFGIPPITLNTGGTVDDGALALNGAATLDGNIINVPEPSGPVLLSSGLVALFVLRHPNRVRSRGRARSTGSSASGQSFSNPIGL